MRSASWWIEWPVGPVRVGVVFLVAVVGMAVAVTYPELVREAGEEADTNSAQAYVDREIAGGNGLVASQQAVLAARALIPADASYHVAVAPDYEGGDELTEGHVASYLRYFLMPRRPGEGGVPWVICYGCDMTEYGPDADVVWRGEDDISIVHVPS